MAYGTVNADVIGTSVAGSNLGAGNASIMKNRIINGAMVIDQRNAGASVTPTTSVYTLDRWNAVCTQSSKYSIQQNAGSLTPAATTGFTKYAGITSLSAYSVASGDVFALRQFVEGFNIADLAWGTASAKTVTLSAWVYSSLTGTFGGSIQNSAQTQSYPFTYSIPVANTWTQISVTITGSTTGVWATDNTTGLQLAFSLGSGSTLSTTAGSWASGNYWSATGATSVVGTSGATFYITGVQLEVGSSATGFEYRQYQQELALCQRYYYKMVSSTATTNYIMLAAESASTAAGSGGSFPVTMRTQPTPALSSGVKIYFSSTGTQAPNSLTNRCTPTSASVSVGWAAGGATGGQAGSLYDGTGSGYIEFSAEL